MRRSILSTEVGSTALTGETGYSVFERTWARPTFEVHGIAGGFTGAGAKTVIPAKAVAKVSIRLVPRQDPEKIVAAVEEFVKENSPAGIQCEVRVLSAGPGLMVNPDHPAIRMAAKAFSDIYGKPTVFTRSGGSIPIVGDFATHLGIPTILMGFGLPDDGLHSPNEKYNIRELLRRDSHCGALLRRIRKVRNETGPFGPASRRKRLLHNQRLATWGPVGLS